MENYQKQSKEVVENFDIFPARWTGILNDSKQNASKLVFYPLHMLT